MRYFYQIKSYPLFYCNFFFTQTFLLNNKICLDFWGFISLDLNFSSSEIRTLPYFCIAGGGGEVMRNKNRIN